jgi:nicotinamide-nucleotide amidase
MFSSDLIDLAASILIKARKAGLKIATAESCTGGLVSACLTEIPGSSDVVERGFIVYSNEAKTDLLGVPAEMIEAHGAVSSDVARALVEGAIATSRAQLAVSITGIAGPGGGTPEKPVGRVYFGSMRAGSKALVERHDFGDIGRETVRLASVKVALRLLSKLL